MTMFEFAERLMSRHRERVPKVSWCATCSPDDIKRLDKTIESINAQTIPPHEIIITTQGNIAQGRNEYLKKATGDYIASFDGGCYYEQDWTAKMIKQLESTDSEIVMGTVLGSGDTRIQRFLQKRLPQYELFTDDDWNSFIPSNRQVIFRRDVIIKIGLIPEHLWRSDDTYWFNLARENGIRFTHCDAVVYWEMKRTLKSYLWSVYNDNKTDAMFKVKPYSAPYKRIDYTPYGIIVSVLALCYKLVGRSIGKFSKALTPR